MSILTGPTLEFEIISTFGPVAFEFIIDARDRIVESAISFPERLDLQNKFQTTLNNFSKKQRRELPASLNGLPLEEGILWMAMIERLNFEFIVSYSSLRPTDELLCRCFGVMKNDVLKVINEGAQDLLTITNLTKASGGCGSCKSDIVELMTLRGLRSPEVHLEGLGIDAEAFSATKKAKYPREKIMELTPLEFLATHIFPMGKEENFEVLGLVENNLYIKADSMVLRLEEFIKENNLKLTTFYS
ncbi:(2Fe-2S)-binding protein [Bacteriovorax sp. Seq25_V]|uniref:(2Fe-2S)-binding protein n=1 Tax=Bacteriovorax sp. Seq25_V TaxID=1201288 RepID=UPI00038A14F0|nr:(2Fe-2S)-binding protein [Bacteriovorax sp. Seq25_V]EQC46094.1 2Fe-2S iron-sulfur cluster-binding domain protein [Bacteriovorax sp. Seq25_V]